MPTKIFLELDTVKQAKIIDAGISEFAIYGFSNSSTNRVVKQSGISKGSLFKYFTNKEDFFFFILDTVTAELSKHMDNVATTLSQELFQRVIEYSVEEFSWYIQNPQKSRLIMMAFSPNEAEVYSKVLARYGGAEQGIYYQLLKEINVDNFRGDSKMTIDILKWFLTGFNADFIKTAKVEESNIEYIKNDYVKKLIAHMEILKAGLLK